MLLKEFEKLQESFGEGTAIVHYPEYQPHLAAKMYEFPLRDFKYKRLIYIRKEALNNQDRCLIKKILADPEDFPRYMGRSETLEPVLMWLMGQYE